MGKFLMDLKICIYCISSKTLLHSVSFHQTFTHQIALPSNYLIKNFPRQMFVLWTILLSEVACIISQII